MKSTNADSGREARGGGIAGSEFRIVLIYALFASLWILFSDSAVGWLFADPRQIVLASTLKGWLFVAVTSLLLFVLIKRFLAQTLAATRRESKAHEEKASALQLLAAIAEHSTDAIFAKDLDGRYLLVNREAARVMGKTFGEVIGRQDSELFPAEEAEQIRLHDDEVIAGMARSSRTRS